MSANAAPVAAPQDAPVKAPIRSCRNGVPVTMLSAAKVPIPCKLTVHTAEVMEEVLHVVSIQRTSFKKALNDKRLSLQIGPNGVILEASNAPAALFGVKPATLVGRNLHELVDILQDLKEDDATLRRVLAAFYTRCVAGARATARHVLAQRTEDRYASSACQSREACALES